MKKIIKQIVEDNGCKLYDITLTEEADNYYYRVYIQKDGGVNLDDCSKINRLISPILDVNEPTQEKYFLEVSSPGIERPLKTKEHFENSIGELVKITTTSGEKIQGKLQGIEDNKLNIKNKIINLDNVKKARTYFEW